MSPFGFFKKSKQDKDNTVNFSKIKENIESYSDYGPMASALKDVKSIIAIASGKGGVGKSTMAVQLAKSMMRSGKRVGLLDADLYGPSCPKLLGIQEGTRPSNENGQIIPLKTEDGIKFMSMGLVIEEGAPLIWRGPMAVKAISQFLSQVNWGELDYLFIDMPPGTGDVQLTISQQAFLSGAIIVTTPHRLASDIAKKGLLMFQQVNVPILGIIENMSSMLCTHCGEENHFSKESGGDKLAKDLNVPLLAKIPMDRDLMDENRKCEDKIKSLLDGLANNVDKRLHEELTGGSKVYTPLGLGVDKESKRPVILWADGHKSEYSPYNLRINCKCAQCIDENTGDRILKKEQISENIKIFGHRPIGRYGLSFQFSDNHKTGIYHFVDLREMREERSEAIN